MCGISAQWYGNTRLKCDTCVTAEVRTPLSAAPWARKGPVTNTNSSVTKSHALLGDHVRKIGNDPEGRTQQFEISGIGDSRTPIRPWVKEATADDIVLQSTSKAAGIPLLPATA